MDFLQVVRTCRIVDSVVILAAVLDLVENLVGSCHKLLVRAAGRWVDGYSYRERRTFGNVRDTETPLPVID